MLHLRSPFSSIMHLLLGGVLVITVEYLSVRHDHQCSVGILVSYCILGNRRLIKFSKHSQKWGESISRKLRSSDASVADSLGSRTIQPSSLSIFALTPEACDQCEGGSAKSWASREKEWDFHLRSLSSNDRDSSAASDPATHPYILQTVRLRLLSLVPSTGIGECIYDAFASNDVNWIVPSTFPYTYGFTKLFLWDWFTASVLVVALEKVEKSSGSLVGSSIASIQKSAAPEQTKGPGGQVVDWPTKESVERLCGQLGRPDRQVVRAVRDKRVDELAIRSFEKENSIDSPLAITTANFLLRPFGTVEKAEEEKNGSAANRHRDSCSTIHPFESFIGQLMSAANEQRSYAASLFNHFREHHPDALVLKLTVVLHASTAIDLRAMSAILRREFLTHSADSHSGTAFWPRLLEPSQEYALLIFSKIAYVSSVVGSHLATLKTLLLAGLSLPSSTNVRLAALSVVVNLLESLKLLVELTGAKAGFVAYQKFGGVIIFMLQIAESDRHEEGTRHLAIEFIITLVEELAPKFDYIIYDLLPYFLGRLFDVLMKMLLDLEDNLVWYTTEVQDENAKETSN
ncbi:hypothetical protein ZIOFF_027220 [Zingiber officinale]|uniref:Uncharacterized protein n=1 Tax=Zingiber officinale TaxID=94328 RepID=A0A8J5H8G4_ZINOF|nr:hypothetical protein ZIOFF_027220 [Zingiber officinale]